MSTYTHIDPFDYFIDEKPNYLIPLIERGIVYYDQCDDDGSTILLWACRYRATKIIHLVVNMGANINRQSFSETALDICEENGMKDMADWLRQKGAKKLIELDDENEEENEENEEENEKNN